MEDIILMKIELLREQMIQLAMDRGLLDAEVIKISKEIDALHNVLNELHPPTSAIKSKDKYDYIREGSIRYSLHYTA